MRTEVYTCDICKQSKSKSDLSQMEVKAAGLMFESGRYAEPKKFDICKDCLKKHGFVVNPKEEEMSNREAENHNENMLRNKLLDVLAELDVQFYE